MNEWLAQYFGTAPVSEETQKQASVELFVKLAAEQNIDLAAMSDADVAQLYEATMGKVAAEGDESEEEKKRIEKATREHEEKKEGQAKFAEAVQMGQVMAHSMVAELDAIEQAKLATTPEDIQALKGGKVPGKKWIEGSEARFHPMPGNAHPEPAFLHHEPRPAPWTPPASRAARLKAYVTEKGRAAGEAAGRAGRAVAEHAKAHKGAYMGAGAGAAGLAAGAGTLAAIHHFGHKKESSALDELAAEAAVDKLAAAGFDTNEAAERLGAILVLGVTDENSKVAFAQNIDEAVEVRSLELAELAGYPVTWTE